MTHENGEYGLNERDGETPGEFSQSEDEADLTNVSNPLNFNAVIMAADWTVETIANQIAKNSFELNPEFQRRDAWDRVKKSRYIESLTTNIPVPQIVLAEKKGSRGRFVVLDGKQRMLSVQQYIRDEFSLSGLDLKPDLNGKKYSELDSEDRYSLDNSTVRTAVVRNWHNEDFLYLIFLRLNTASSPLSPQELRQALHPGPFVSFVNRYTTENLEFSRIMSSRIGPDFRMRDVEILIRFFAFSRYLSRYRGNLKEFLDVTCESLNDEVEKGITSLDELGESAEACRGAIVTVEKIFSENAFRRWNGRAKKFERGFNRAVFDVLTYYAKDLDVRTAMESDPSGTIEAFKSACENDRFTEAITNTTKTNRAVQDRLIIWGKKLDDTLGVNITLPGVTEGGYFVED